MLIKKVTLSSTEPLATSQLVLTVPADTTPGDHPFTILAMSDKGDTKKIQLTLKVESTSIIVTTITLVLQANEVSFMGKLSLSGQLVAFSGKTVPLSDLAIKVIFTAPSGEAQTFESKTDSDGNYRLASFSPDEIGKWSVKAQFDSNTKLFSG